MPALFSYIYLSSKALSPLGCSLNGTMQSVSSELSRYPFVCAGGRSFAITCSGVLILDEVIGMEKKFKDKVQKQDS